MNDDEDIKRIICYFKSTDEVSALYIFGSFGKDIKTVESDIDIAVLIDESKLKRKSFELLRKSIATVFCLFLIITIASALDCPKQPEQTKKDWDAEVGLAVAKIGPAKGADLKIKARKATQDLLSKLPKADRLYIEQMMYATYCSALRDDRSITESEKARRVKAYNAEVRKTFINQPQIKKTKSEPDKNVKSTDKSTPGSQTVIASGEQTVAIGVQGNNTGTIIVNPNNFRVGEIPDIKDLLKKNDEVLDKEFERQLQESPLGKVQRTRDYYYLGNQALAAPSPRYKDAADYYQKSIKEYATKPAYSKLIYCRLMMQDFSGVISDIEDAYRLVKEKDLQAYDEFFKERDDEILVIYLIEVVRSIEKERGKFVLFGLFEKRDDPGLWQIAYSAEWFVPGKDDSYVVHKVADMLQGKPQWRMVEFKSFESLKISENFVQGLLTQLEQLGRLGRLIFWTNASGFYKRVYIISAHEPKNKY